MHLKEQIFSEKYEKIKIDGYHDYTEITNSEFIDSN